MDDDDHPLLVELNSLRDTAARFQHEAHAAAIKLQHHSLDASRTYEHAAALEQENARLTHEVTVLRAHQEVPHHPAVAQAQELSLALRRVSDRIALTEDTLLERTSELAYTRNELSRARHAADSAYELAARMRAREEAAKARERELELKAQASEEERKMVDLVVEEYAALVRNLEGRKSYPVSPSMISPLDTLQNGKFRLHEMLTAFSIESEGLHTTIAELNARVSSLQTTLDTERLAASHDRTLLSQYKTQLDKHNLEDQTAAKMVARYMKFSQTSTNTLQQQITTLKTRHASTTATLELQLASVESQLAAERARSTRLQDALDELCEDLARESYGRRREVALRLSLLSREEGITEFIRRWARRARELYARCYNVGQPVSSEDPVQEAFHRVVTDAESLLSSLDDEVQFSDGTQASGSMARIALSRSAVDAMRSELQDEMQKRIEAVRRVANGHLEVPIRPESVLSQEGDGTPDRQLLSPNVDASLEHEMFGGLSQPRDSASPVSMVNSPEESVGDPLAVPVGRTVIQDTCSPSIRSSASTSVTLFVEEELKSALAPSPAVSMLDLQEPFITDGPPTANVVSIRTLPSDTPISDAHVVDIVIPSPLIVPHATVNSLQSPREETSPATAVAPIHPSPSGTPAQVSAEEDKVTPSTSMSTPMSASWQVTPSTDVPPTLLSELGATRHRYDALQRAFRDCSLALKELKRSLAPSSPSPRIQTKLRRHLETALARIDDYVEDARVELEIRVADEELTLRGFEMVLSVPGALADPAERAEVETSARAFVDGADTGVARALDKFGKKLEDVQHDVAMVKRAVHGLAMREGEDDAEGDAGAGWTAWTAGLFGAGATQSRSPTPVETFGAVMTSPQLRHAASLKQLQGQEGAGTGTGERGPLAGLNLRIPMPTESSSPWTHLGLGRSVEETHPRTLSAMYAVGGLRSSSVGLGVGLGGSSSTRTRSMTGLGMGMGNAAYASSSRVGAGNDTRAVGDLGGVE